jgi:hypothetical protein
MTEETPDVHCAISIGHKQNQRHVGACVRQRVPRESEEDSTQWSLKLYDFLDNDQFSNLDSFLIQIGQCIVVVADEIEDNSKADNRKVRRILEGCPQVGVQTVKKTMFKRADSCDILRRLVGKESHESTVAEVGDLFLAFIGLFVKWYRT